MNLKQIIAEEVKRQLTEAEEPEVIQQLQNLVDTKSRGKVTDPKTGRKATVDTFTASVVLSLYNRLNDTQKPKYVARGLQYMIDFASRNYK